MENYEKHFKRLEEIENTHPISMDGIMQVVEQVTYMSDYGIYTGQVCNWLKGICHNDFGWSNQLPITKLELYQRLKLSNDVLDMATFWNTVLKKKIEELENEDQKFRKELKI
jgi:hypothetical protein